MAPTPPSSIPAEITAGDTATWQRAGGDYPASDGWALAYTLISASAVLHISAAANGDDYLVTVDAATTAGWAADTYRVQEFVSRAAERHTLGTYTLRVLPNLATASAGLDTRSHAQKVLDSINAYMETKAPVYGAMEINGRKISYYPLPDLLKLRDRYRLEVLTEQRLASGGFGGNRILAVL